MPPNTVILPQRAIAFAMGLHPRLGRDSAVNSLPVEVLRVVLEDVMDLVRQLVVERDKTARITETRCWPNVRWMLHNSNETLHNRTFRRRLLQLNSFLFTDLSVFCNYHRAACLSNYFVLFEPPAAHASILLRSEHPHEEYSDDKLVFYLRGVLQTVLPYALRFHVRLSRDGAHLQVFIFGLDTNPDAILQSETFLSNRIETLWRGETKVVARVIGRRSSHSRKPFIL